MSRYIDAEQFICELDGSECLDTERDYDEIAKRLEECETADVQEIKHGIWIKEEKSVLYVCSSCGERVYRDYYKFCPNCGAKMDGDTNGDE